MAKYDVTYKCGHTGEVNQYGKETERTKKRAWIETQDCPACGREAEQDAADTYAKEHNLPALTKGSEKQVAWAQRIRHRVIMEAHAFKKQDKFAQADELTKKCVNDAFRKLTIQSNAQWWITQESADGAIIVEHWAKEAYLASTKG